LEEINLKFFNFGEYEINMHTMALVPAFDVVYSTKVIDAVLGEVFVKEAISQLLQTACLEGGASLDGRKKYTEYQLGISQKLPLAVDPFENIFAFPTMSAKQPNCVWIFVNHIHKTDAKGKLAIVTFRNGYVLELDISHLILQRQIQRVAMLYHYFSLKRR
jgi:competence protein ComK